MFCYHCHVHYEKNNHDKMSRACISPTGLTADAPSMVLKRNCNMTLSISHGRMEEDTTSWLVRSSLWFVLRPSHLSFLENREGFAGQSLSSNSVIHVLEDVPTILLTFHFFVLYWLLRIKGPFVLNSTAVRARILLLLAGTFLSLPPALCPALEAFHLPLSVRRHTASGAEPVGSNNVLTI